MLPISELGLLEMTRQRMRPSLRMANYVECSGCSGQGELKSSDAVANDILREIGFLLHCSETDRVEVAVAPRVASSLLSTRRRMLDAIEQRMGKQVDVRIIESFAGDRVEYYAYDARGADLDLDALTPNAKPTLIALQAEMDLTEEELESDVEKKASGRRRRRRSKAPAADATAIAMRVSGCKGYRHLGGEVGHWKPDGTLPSTPVVSIREGLLWRTRRVLCRIANICKAGAAACFRHRQSQCSSSDCNPRRSARS